MLNLVVRIVTGRLLKVNILAFPTVKFPIDFPLLINMFVGTLSIDRQTYQLVLNTLRTGDADLRFYVTTVQDG